MAQNVHITLNAATPENLVAVVYAVSGGVWGFAARDPKGKDIDDHDQSSSLPWSSRMTSIDNFS
jgi:hypothetical protein